MKQTLLLLLLGFSLAFVGCKATLEPGGPYAPTGQQADMPFYVVDGAFNLAYTTVDATFKWEKDNRAALWKLSPDIKKTLDTIRPEASKVVKQYATARSAYLKNPTPEGLSDLQFALATIRKVADVALATIPKGN
jgi:hypothetical protein